MFTLRHTPIALALLSLYSMQTLAAETVQSNERMNIVIAKGNTSPNATTQNYTGDDVIKIEPTKSDINKTIDELIAENSPGFVHTNSGTSKHVSNNYHRGLSDEYTLYLLNGVPFPTSTLGSQSIPGIPMESIERIEVIRGAQASLYGSSSLTGVINIITKTGENMDAQLNISTGSNDTQRIAGVYANNIDKLHFMTSIDIDKSDGYDFIEGSDDEFGYQTYSMNSYLAYVTDTNRFSLSLTNATANVEINDSVCNWNANTSECDYISGAVDTTQDTLQMTGKYIQKYNKNITSEFTLSTSEVSSDSHNYGSEDVDHYQTNESLAQLHFNTQWKKISANFGGEYIYTKYESNDNGEDRKQAATYFALSSDITDNINVSAGLRGDDYSDFGNALTYSAGLSLFKIASISYKTSFSAPSYNDLYWPDAGNPDLESEEGKMLELALTHNINTTNAYIPLKFNVYRGSLDNKIDWAPNDPSNPYSTWSPYNIGKVKVQGAEAYIQYNAKNYTFDIAGAYSESVDKSTNEQLNNVPEWSGSSSIQYNITNSIKPKFIYSYIGKRTTSNSGDLKEAHILGFAINYQVMKNFNASFNINNITDNDQQLHNGYNADGRTFMLTLGANL